MTLETEMLPKQEIARSNYFWILYKTTKGYDLSVLCGRSAVYSVEFPLNEEETRYYEAQGTSYIDSLASQVQSNPKEYRDRNH
jgi:hypothetical protein